MQTRARVALVAGLLVALAGANVWLWAVQPPGHREPRALTLHGPFAHDQGFGYKTELALEIPSDDTSNASASSLELLEDDRPLGPAHAEHRAIARAGAGRFSHWGSQLYFSTSDNTDPNTNGRRYHVRYDAALPAGLYVALLLVTYLTVVLLALWAFERLPERWSRLWPLLRAASLVVLTLGLVQTWFWIVTEDVVARQPLTTRQWYAHLFHGGAPGFSPGRAINYAEHHYLNYALNPAMPYGGTRQFNAAFRIRRTEPIRPRDQVRWRILALGGSTTFGEGIPQEEQTWVHQLEQRVRRACGADCDVINGGVGGYTVVENFIHYATLLTNLQPDVVLLYEGINDVWPRLAGELQPDYSNYRRPWRSAGAVLPAPAPALAWLQPYRYYFVKTHLLHTLERGIGALASRSLPPEHEWAAALERNGPDVFRTHLRHLVRLIRAQGRTPVIVPQHFVVKREPDAVFGRGVAQHNQVDREVAAQEGALFLAAVLDPASFSEEDTGDNCHFTKAGSVKMAEVVFTFLDSHRLFPARSEPSRPRPSPLSGGPSGTEP